MCACREFCVVTSQSVCADVLLFNAGSFGCESVFEVKSENAGGGFWLWWILHVLSHLLDTPI